MAWKIDEIDRKILELLKNEAKMPNARLGKKVGLSEPAARRRVANLERRGVIRRFTIDIEEKAAVQSLLFVNVNPHVPSEKVVSELAKVEGVGSMWELSGDIDFSLLLSAPDMETLNSRVDAIRNLPAVVGTKTSILMKRWK
jgi:DNA-binding Lrp family transcriptional regulator